MMKNPSSSTALDEDNVNDGSGTNPKSPKTSASANSFPPYKKLNVKSFLKIGLAAMVAFHFVWISKQMHSLSINSADPDMMLSPELEDAPYETFSKSDSHSSRVGSPPSASSYSSPFDPRGKPLPSHPFPNAELRELVGSDRPYSCPPGLIYVKDHILPDKITHRRTMSYSLPENATNTNGTTPFIPNVTYGKMTRLIPRLFHITAKSRCMTKSFATNVENWIKRLGNSYSIYIHDDLAVNKFLYHKKWVEFPELQEVVSGCIVSGAGKADIWRYLILWEYGGVYSDMDSAPNKFGEDSIADDDDAWYPLEGLGIPAQYFFASSPRHPIMYLSAKWGLNQVANLDDITKNNAAKTTGPGAFKNGFILFQQFKGIETSGYVPAGVYVGAHDRTVKVVGTKENSREWIFREGVGGKDEGYEAMNMTHFHKSGRKFNLLHSDKANGCVEERWKMHMGRRGWNAVV